MNKLARKLVVLTVFAMALSGFVLAQDSTYQVNANIPFDFYAGSQQLPAGAYTFVVSYGDHSVVLRNKSTGRSYELLARPDSGDGFVQAVVEFDVVGGAHLLADLKTASAGVNFPEQKVVVAAGQGKKSIAIVAALR